MNNVSYLLYITGHIKNGEAEGPALDDQMNLNERQKDGETSRMIEDTSPTTARLLEHRQLLNEMSEFSFL